MRKPRGRLLPLLAIAIAACIAASGCGGDDAPAAAEQKEPKTYKAFARYLAALIAEADDSADCKQLRQIGRRSTEDIPCPAPERLRERMGSFDMVDSGLFVLDNLGIVDYKPTEADRTVMVLFLNSDGRWSVDRLALDVGDAHDNKRGEGEVSIKTMRVKYERAVRAGDCEEQLRLTYRPVGVARASCEDQLARNRELMRVLRANPAQLPAYAGGDSDFGTYSLTTFAFDKRWHYNFVAIKATIGGENRYFMLDVIRDEPAQGTQPS